MEKSDIRRAMLEDSYRLQQFERDCDETKGWISEKLKTAMDESYLVSRIYGSIISLINFQGNRNDIQVFVINIKLNLFVFNFRILPM